MNTQDYILECSQCGKKIGGLSLTYNGIPHHLGPVACCKSCLPARLDKLEKEGYDQATIDMFRKWLEE